MEKYSYFIDFKTPKDSFDMSQIIGFIKNGAHAEQINLLREFIKAGDTNNADNAKKQLPGFTPSGLFSTSRSEANLSQYSRVLHVDFDKLTTIELLTLTNSFKQNKKVYAFFISPSGKGVKVFFKINSGSNEHRKKIELLFEYVESEWGLIPDKQCKDLSRLCFMSYDPNAYINVNAEILALDDSLIDKRVETAYQKTSAKKEYIEGNRNSFIWEFGRQCKQQKMLLEDAYESSLQKFSDMPKAEIYRTIRSSYMHRYDLPTQNTERISRLGKYAPLENVLKEEYDFRFNLVTKYVEFKKKENSDFIIMKDFDFNNLMIFIDASGHKLSQIDLNTILESDFSESYNPFVAYLYALPEWDGFDHIGDMASTIEVDNPEYFEKCLKRWLIAMIASVLNDDIVNQHVLTLVGEQGVGKTTWLNNLCPKELKDYVYHGSMRSSDKDSLAMLAESIIINVDELEALTRKQIEEFKELVTKVSVRIRRPYARFTENMPRRASFCASINSGEFLNDPTGSRRFLVHWTRAINNKHNLDIDQLYTHALHLYLNSEKYWFDPNEIIQINNMNKQFQVESLEEELLLNHFEPATEECDCMSASEILLYIQGREEGVKLQVNIIGKMLAKNGFEKVSRNGRKKWLVKKR